MQILSALNIKKNIHLNAAKTYTRRIVKENSISPIKIEINSSS
jgi:hypothetical protein